MTAICLGSLAVLVYTYLGYPVLIALLARLFPLRITVDDGWRPLVTFCIPTVGAQDWLRSKLDTIAVQSYPPDKIEVLIYSDGATDGTDEMVRAFAEVHPNVRLLVGEGRAGKPTALNRMFAEAKGELLVLTDSRQTLEPETLLETVRAMSDPRVGCASGHIELRGHQGAGFYWRYDAWIRRSEGRFRSTSGATGMYYAVRKADVEPLPTDTILDDMWISMKVRLKRKRLVYAERARVWDVAFDDDREFGRKVRTLAGAFQHFAREPRLLVPLVNPSWFETFSHRVLRLVGPWALLALLVSSLIGGFSPGADPRGLALFRFLAAGELALVALALLGPGGGRLAAIARTFLVMNAAAVAGLWRWASGRQKITW